MRSPRGTISFDFSLIAAKVLILFFYLLSYFVGEIKSEHIRIVPLSRQEKLSAVLKALGN